jgi:hypothetical protein
MRDEGIFVKALMAECTIAVTLFAQKSPATAGESQIRSAMRVEPRIPSNPGDSMPDSAT